MALKNRIRRQFNLPWKKKSPLFLFLAPLLFLLAAFVAFVAKIRRKKGYASEYQGQYPIVCLGNFLMGGTGKSPLIQYFSDFFCKKDWDVAVFSRGISANPTIFYGESCEDSSQLSDENREHVFYMKKRGFLKKFSVYQDPQRNKSLEKFQKFMITKPAEQKALVFLDDGLQHFSCPRTHNIAVIDAKLFQTAPPFPFPIGPYREGWGRGDLISLHQGVDLRIWTRTKLGKLPEFLKLLETIQAEFSFPLEIKKDYIAVAQTHFELWEAGNDKSSPVSKEQISVNEAGFLCGIADPQHFLEETQEQWNVKFQNPLLLDDHQVWNQKIHQYVLQHEILFLTAKDFGRFFDQLSLLPQKKIIVGRLEFKLYNLELKEVTQWEFP